MPILIDRAIYVPPELAGEMYRVNCTQAFLHEHGLTYLATSGYWVTMGVW